MNVGIVDCGMGNLQSVYNAFEVLGYDVIIHNRPDDLRDSSHIILPGVGAFPDQMRSLKKSGWLEALEENVIVKGKPFLGICLGLQVLASFGTEHKECEGLNWIAGRVERLEETAERLRIPHIGWNDVVIEQSEGLYQDMYKVETFYFVHSYSFKSEDQGVVTGKCSYGMDFIASVCKDNIYATQYHPEKSQKSGLKVLDNFIKTTR